MRVYRCLNGESARETGLRRAHVFDQIVSAGSAANDALVDCAFGSNRTSIVECAAFSRETKWKPYAVKNGF